MDDKLTQKKIEKLEKNTKTLQILAGTGFALAVIFGVLWLTSGSRNVDQKLNAVVEKVDLDTIDYKGQVSDFNLKEETYANTIDSMTTVLLVLEDTVTSLKNQLLLSAPISHDYISQMIENAKLFSSTDCNKSLAFLYAAKKVASMEKRIGPNVDAIQTMIKKCEANVFGTSPSASTE